LIGTLTNSQIFSSPSEWLSAKSRPEAALKSAAAPYTLAGSLASGATLNLAENLGIRDEFEAGVDHMQATLERIGETALALPSKTRELLSDLELSVPEIPDLGLPADIPRLDPPLTADLPQLGFDAPQWLERYAKTILGEGGSQTNRTASATTGGAVDFSGSSNSSQRGGLNVDMGPIEVSAGQAEREIQRAIEQYDFDGIIRPIVESTLSQYFTDL